MNVPEYTPGDWYAVVTPGVVLLLAPSTPPEVVRDVWAGAPEQGGGLGAQLDALVRHGIGGLHPFAAVDLATGAVQTALRGDVEVEVVRGTRAEVLSAPRVVSWSERAVGAADEVTVRVAGAGRGPSLPLVSGIVRASRVRVRLTGSDAAVVPPSTAGPVVLAATPVPVAVAASAPAAPDVEPAPARPAEPGERVESGERVEPAALADGGPETGDTLPGSVVPAWFPVADDDATGTTGTTDGAVVEAADGTAGGAAEPAEAADATALLPAVDPAPSVASPALASPALPGPASADDHDGLTILSGELASIRQNLPSWAVSQTGEWPAGVPTPVLGPPATAAQPAAGGGGAVAQATVPCLALSTGVRVPLDALVLIGRAPQEDRAPDGARTRLVTVPSPEQDISRTHAEVRLEHGRVLVTDLYSTNGITVAGGGLPPRRVTAGEPVVVGDGDVVDLGDGVTFFLEPGA